MNKYKDGRKGKKENSLVYMRMNIKKIVKDSVGLRKDSVFCEEDQIKEEDGENISCKHGKYYNLECVYVYSFIDVSHSHADIVT
jgi:hypothetical protein